MRNLLALIGLLVVGAGGLGWYLGWYKLSFTHNSEGNLQVTTNVDTNRVVTDIGGGLRKGSDMITNLNSGNQSQNANPPGNTPGPATTPQAGSTESGWLFGPGFFQNAQTR